MSSTDPLITDIWRTGSGQSKRFGEPLAVADGDGIREHRQPGEPTVDTVPAPLAGSATATGRRDLRDWLHAASLPATMTGEAVLHELNGIRRARPTTRAAE